MADLEISLLGDPRFSYKNAAFAFTAPPKTLPMLAYILLNRSAPVSREKLAGILWPDEIESDGRANVRRHLHYLQRALPAADAPWVLSDTKTLTWNAQADLWFDVAAFEGAAETLPALQKAVALYRGDLLESVYDDWIFYDRERLRGMQISKLDRLIGLHAQAGEFAESLRFAQQLMMLDPWREDAVRAAITARIALGDRAGAASEYERFAERLKRDLGVEPMPETRESLTLSPMPVVRSQATILGREHELQRLSGWWARAARGRAAIALIGGEAGIGKTTVSRALLEQAQEQGALTLTGSTSFSENLPYEPFIEAFQSIDSTANATLHGEFSAAILFSPYVQDEDHKPFFNQVVERIRTLAAQQPVVMLLEDLHWAGDATIALLEYAVRALGDAAVFFVGTYREEEVTRDHPLRATRRRLTYERFLSHLALSPLTPEASRGMIAAELGEAEAERFADALVERSGGNPLFLREMIRDIAESGGPSDVPPKNIRAIVEARVAKLSRTSRVAAETAAVCGPAFDVELLCEVSGLAEHEVDQSIGELLDRHLVREAGAANREDYTFSHEVIRRTIYDLVSPELRARRHLRIAGVMESLYASDPEHYVGAIAFHFEAGGDGASAVPYYIAAAQNALNLYANHETVEFATRGLLYATAPHDRMHLLTRRETAYRRLGMRDAQHGDVLALRELQPFADADAYCEIIMRDLFYAKSVGDLTREVALVEELRERAESAALPRWLATTLFAAGSLEIRAGEYAAAKASLTEAFRLFKELSEVTEQVLCAVTLTEVGMALGESTREWIDAGRALATDYALKSRVLQAEYRVAEVAEDFTEMRTIAREMLEAAKGAGDTHLEALAHRHVATASMNLFDIAAAREHFEHARALFERVGNRLDMLGLRFCESLLCLRVGALEEAATNFADLTEKLREEGQHPGMLSALCNLSWAQALNEQFEGSARNAHEALRLGREADAQLYVDYAHGMLGGALRGLGKYEEAYRELRTALEASRKWGQHQATGYNLGELVLACIALGRAEALRESMTELEALLRGRESDMAFPEVLYHVLAQAHAFFEDSAQSARCLRDAHRALTERLEMIPDALTAAKFAAMPVHREITGPAEPVPA